jgi:hypothetical protein
MLIQFINGVVYQIPKCPSQIIDPVHSLATFGTDAMTTFKNNDFRLFIKAQWTFLVVSMHINLQTFQQQSITERNRMTYRVVPLSQICIALFIASFDDLVEGCLV